MDRHVVKTDPHLLAWERARDVHAQGARPGRDLRNAPTNLVERSALDIDFVTWPNLLICHGLGTSGQVRYAQA